MTNAKMKAGMVVQIRVHPEDCLSILDIMKVIGNDPYDGRSFASMTSLALKALIGFAVKSQVIEEPDGFQFLNRMAPFLDSRNNKRKHTISESLYNRAAHGERPTIERPSDNRSGPFIPQHAQGAAQAMGWTSNGPVTTAAVPLAPDPVVAEMVQEEYATLMELIRDGEPTAEQLKRFSDLQTLLFP